MAKSYLMPIIVVVIIAAFVILILALANNSNVEVKFLEDDRYDSVTFATQEEAIEKANEIGCSGFHTHEQNFRIIFMACEKHSDLDPFVLGSEEDQVESGSPY